MTDIRVLEKGNTFYGDKLISIKDVVLEKNIEQAIRVGLKSIFDKIGLSEKQLLNTINYCIDSAKNYSNLLNYEYLIHNFLEKNGIFEKYFIAKKDRASIRFRKIKQHLTGETILDLGCGSGKIGEMLYKEGYKITLSDVYKNPNIDKLDIPFYKIKDSQILPFKDNSFDNVLLLSMLHHTQNPLFVLDECKRILKKNGRLNLIETVYGIPNKAKNGSYKTDDSFFKSLLSEQQRKVSIFFDYFGNHILDSYTEDLDKYVPVPFNFTTPYNLEQIFKNKDFNLISKEYLGIYPFSYNYHVHLVYSK